MQHRSLAVALGLAVIEVALARDGDPLQSADCRAALDALAAQEVAADAASQPARDREARLAALRDARRGAAHSCLGSRADAPPARHIAEPPLRVAPVAIPPPVRPVPAPPIAVPPPPAPPLTVLSCDPAGCWASDGTRLLRNGPDLVGPRGLCTVTGGVLHCP